MNETSTEYIMPLKHDIKFRKESDTRKKFKKGKKKEKKEKPRTLRSQINANCCKLKWKKTFFIINTPSPCTLI